MPSSIAYSVLDINPFHSMLYGKEADEDYQMIESPFQSIIGITTILPHSLLDTDKFLILTQLDSGVSIFLKINFT